MHTCIVVKRLRGHKLSLVLCTILKPCIKTELTGCSVSISNSERSSQYFAPFLSGTATQVAQASLAHRKTRWLKFALTSPLGVLRIHGASELHLVLRRGSFLAEEFRQAGGEVLQGGRGPAHWSVLLDGHQDVFAPCHGKSVLACGTKKADRII